MKQREVVQRQPRAIWPVALRNNLFRRNGHDGFKGSLLEVIEKRGDEAKRHGEVDCGRLMIVVENKDGMYQRNKINGAAPKKKMSRSIACVWMVGDAELRLQGLVEWNYDSRKYLAFWGGDIGGFEQPRCLTQRLNS